MSANLRQRYDDEGNKYVSVEDVLKLLAHIINMEGMHPVAVEALDGLGIGLALALKVVTLDDLPENTRALLLERYGHV